MIIKYLIEIDNGANYFDAYKKIKKLSLAQWNSKIGTNAKHFTFKAYFRNTKEYNKYIKNEEQGKNIKIFERQFFIKNIEFRYKHEIKQLLEQF